MLPNEESIVKCALCERESGHLSENGLCDICRSVDESVNEIWQPTPTDQILTEIEQAENVDQVSGILGKSRPPTDPMEQAVLREKLLKALSKKVASPAKLVDAWLGSAPKNDEIVDAQAGVLVNLVLENAQLFHDPHDEPYARIRIGDHTENHRMKSKSFDMWLRKLWYDNYKAASNPTDGGSALTSILGAMLGRTSSPAPQQQAVRDAIASLSALAVFEGEQHEVKVRVAGYGDRVYVDLGSEDWTAVEVTGTGWKVVSDPPVRFVRAPGMLPLPAPVDGGELSDLRQFVNVSDEDWPIMAGFIAGVFMPHGPYPVLNLLGEQGSAKTSTGRFIRRLVDPWDPLDRGRPRSEQELAISAEWNWILCFDNLGSIAEWLSDALCRISTGGGFAARALYTDDEEKRFSASRPIILNGIADVATRGDLLDRSVVVSLPRLEVRDLEQLEADFEEAWPMLLGSCLTLCSTALANKPNIVLEETPRMADFAKWAVAAEPAMGIPEHAFIDGYLENRKAGRYVVIESDPTATALMQFMDDKDNWSGTMTELLEVLNMVATDSTIRSKEWPKAANALSRKLKRLAPDLRAVGLDVALPSSYAQGRRLTITNLRKDRPDRPDPTDNRLIDPDDLI